MKREKFIKKTVFGCLGLMAGPMLFNSCSGTLALNLPVENGKIKVQKDSFTVEKKAKSKELRQLVVKSSTLDYPIVLYKYSEISYRAMLLRCTHQGTELNVYGDLIGCPAHGSEFNNQGGVIQGPAKDGLKEFDTQLTQDHIIISLT